MAHGGACFICDKHQRGADVPGGVLHRDDLVYAGHVHPLDGPTAALGYLVVEPLRHVAALGDLTDDEAARIGVVANRLSRLVREVAGAEHVYAFVFGDTIPHLHVHLAPRYPGSPAHLQGLGAVGIQRSVDVPRGDRAAVDELCDRLRAAISTPPDE